MPSEDIFSGRAEFIAVADTESFTAAAKKMGVSTSHISRQITRLETQLGARLFNRTTRRVTLTEGGIDYYQSCLLLKQQLEEADAKVRGEHAKLSGKVRISTAGDFSEMVISSALATFMNQHPGLSIELNFNTRVVNLLDEGFDFAIRYGTLKDSNQVARLLLNRRLIAAASKEYLAQNGYPQKPTDLLRHNCLISNSTAWVFDNGNKQYQVRVQSNWFSNSARAVLASAVAGNGIVYLPETSFGKLLDEKKLEPVLADYCWHTIPSWVVYPDRRYLSFRSRQVIEYLLEYFQAFRPDTLIK